MSVRYPISRKNNNGTLTPVASKLPISSGFGPRGSSFHNGIDIPTPVGSELVAPETGVLKFYVNEAGGNQITITTADGRRFGFAHLKDLNIAKALGNGAMVKKGQVIGLTGNTGRSTGPHLHFTYAEQGQLKDPKTLSFSFSDNVPLPINLPLPQLPSTVIIVILILVLLIVYLFKKGEFGPLADGGIVQT